MVAIPDAPAWKVISLGLCWGLLWGCLPGLSPGFSALVSTVLDIRISLDGGWHVPLYSR